MGHNIAEKIIGERVGREVGGGEFVVAEVDVYLIHDGTGPAVVRELERLQGLRRFVFPPRTAISKGVWGIRAPLST